MKFSRIKKLLIAVVLMAGLFVGLHSTPALATRTHIFMEGYPLDAIGKAIPSYVITKSGFLYFAHDYDSWNTP